MWWMRRLGRCSIRHTFARYRWIGSCLLGLRIAEKAQRPVEAPGAVVVALSTRRAADCLCCSYWCRSHGQESLVIWIVEFRSAGQKCCGCMHPCSFSCSGPDLGTHILLPSPSFPPHPNLLRFLLTSATHPHIRHPLHTFRQLPAHLRHHVLQEVITHAAST